MIYKIISGFQMGADIAGIRVGLDLGLETGGMMPNGFRTKWGSRPQYSKYGAVEHPTSDSYVPRTKWNVKNSDATIRFAYNHMSPGEVCTYKAIEQYGKPYFDVDLNAIDSGLNLYFIDVVTFLLDNNVGVLNVAGNCGATKDRAKAIYSLTRKVLTTYVTICNQYSQPKDTWTIGDIK